MAQSFKRKGLNPWVYVMIHACLFGVICLIARGIYRDVDEANKAAQQAAEKKPEPVKPVRITRSSQTPPPAIERHDEPKPEPPPKKEAVSHKPKFAGLPTTAELPAANNPMVESLANGLPEAELHLLTNDADLLLDGSKVLYNKEVVAGLRLVKGALEFRWLPKAPAEAISAVRNSVVKFIANGELHYVALRRPVMIVAPKWDGTRSVARILAKCDDWPPAETVLFDLLPQLPPNKVDGGELTGLGLRSQRMIDYESPPDCRIATKLTVKKIGNVAALELDTRYVLPSGDEEGLDISKGNRKLKKLQGLLSDAIAAQAALPKLQSYFGQCQSNLSRAQSMSTMVRTAVGAIENPVAVGQKAQVITYWQNELAAANDHIIKAKQLIADRPAIDKDLKAANLIAEFSKKLGESRLQYRAYMMVRGQRVDLIIAE